MIRLKSYINGRAEIFNGFVFNRVYNESINGATFGDALMLIFVLLILTPEIRLAVFRFLNCIIIISLLNSLQIF